VAPERVHAIAHQLEHLNDPASVQVVDHLLGHPLEDPHGSQIPAGNTHEPGHKVRASELRPGDQAVVQSMSDRAAASGLRDGDRVVCGPRRDGGRTWVLQREDREIRLDHDQADAVWVEMLNG
jgi:hypothetical protein